MTVDQQTWVTGAGTGIGRELAKRLALGGRQVAVSARTDADLLSLAAEVPAHIHPFPLDVAQEAAIPATVAAIENQLGPLDLVVLCAGTYQPVYAKDFDLTAFRRTVEVNLIGTVSCLAAIMPGMIARKSGHIAIVASVAGFVGLPGAAAYGATKAALNNLVEALQPDLERYGVRLSIINPGFVDTPLTRKNDFPMPFLMPVDKAVDRIVAGLERGELETSFPWQMSLGMRLLGLLPDGFRLSLTRRMLR